MTVEQTIPPDPLPQDQLPKEGTLGQELDHQEGPSAHDYERRWWTLGVLCISLVMIVMANASLNVALPTLARDLKSSVANFKL